ncbi:molybdate ABC transporter substrate-binding protein [Lewinella sp. 4G2]|nr:molybdate ABC transporter substrate-binding protein [Lewinella sp. 4G2]
MLISALLVFVTSCGPAPDSPTLTIAAASSLRPALENIVDEYERETGTTCEIVYGSSGKLTAQILAGAPYDVFLSASDLYTEQLQQKNRTGGPAQFIASGQLAIWSYSERYDSTWLQYHSPAPGRIAIPNPTTAPYGIAAIDYLKGAGLYQDLSDQLVYGESVGQTAQFIQSGAAEVGLVALSIPLSLPPAERGNVRKIEPETHLPIKHWAVTIKRNDTPAEQSAKRFVTFLQEERVKGTWGEFGFLLETLDPRF